MVFFAIMVLVGNMVFVASTVFFAIMVFLDVNTSKVCRITTTTMCYRILSQSGYSDIRKDIQSIPSEGGFVFRDDHISTLPWSECKFSYTKSTLTKFNIYMYIRPPRFSPFFGIQLSSVCGKVHFCSLKTMVAFI